MLLPSGSGSSSSGQPSSPGGFGRADTLRVNPPRRTTGSGSAPNTAQNASPIAVDAAPMVAIRRAASAVDLQHVPSVPIEAHATVALASQAAPAAQRSTSAASDAFSDSSRNLQPAHGSRQPARASQRTQPTPLSPDATSRDSGSVAMPPSALAATAAEPRVMSGGVAEAYVVQGGVRGLSTRSAPPPRFDVAIAAAVSRASAAVSADARTLRDACAALCNTLMMSRAIDSRSLARAYGDRLPHDVAVPPQSIVSATDAASGGALPIVCDVDVSAAKALDVQLRSGAVGSLILSCLRHSHDNVQADGLALLCVLADTTLDVSSPAMDELSDVVFGSEEEASRVSSGCANISDTGSKPLHSQDLPVRMTSLTVCSQPTLGLGTSAGVAGVQVVTVVPVYALGLMLGGSTATKPTGGAAPPTALTVLSSGGGGGPNALFRDIYSSLVFLTTVSTESQRSPGKRAVAALRRACPVAALLTCTLATLCNPAAEQRSLWSALMLAYSMLGEPGESNQ